MASLETTTPLLEEKAEATQAVAAEQWKPAAIVADIATLGTGTLIAGVFNVALVFLVPKLISVADYGYWRIFILYAGYVGFLHFGFADGALLRWAGRPLEDVHHELRPAIKYLFWQHVAVLLPACVLAAVLLRGPLRFVAIAVAIYAPLFNITAALQFSLQGARNFRPVAISAVAAPALFCLSALLWAIGWRSTFREVVTLFLLGWCVPLSFLLIWTKPWAESLREIAPKNLGRQCMLSGWPIMMANTGVVLIVTADRLAASWAASIQDFAQYSLAASAMAVPTTAIAACSKVFFPHLARLEQDRRKRVYGISSWLLLIAWMILLPFYFALDIFVRHALPKYVPSLPYARILLLAVPFIAVIQILQMNYAYLNGIQRKFLAQTVVALVVSVGAMSFAVFHARSLGVLADTQVVVLGVWWLCNEWTLRSLTGQSDRDLAKFGGAYVLASLSYWITTAWTERTQVSVLAYYVGIAIVLMAFCREQLQLWARMVLRARAAQQLSATEGK